MQRKPYSERKCMQGTSTARVFEILSDGQPHEIQEVEAVDPKNFFGAIVGILRRPIQTHRDGIRRGYSSLVLRDNTIQLYLAPMELPGVSGERRKTTRG